jgi:protein-L-isoaspartate(D-aspartate) O-methyltransferase
MRPSVASAAVLLASCAPEVRFSAARPPQDKMAGFDDRSTVGLRAAMVSDQIVARGVSDLLTINAMRRVPRHEFVPADERERAYEDRPLGIGSGQTVCRPWIVASMVAALGLKGGERVLEIGTGSGYQAAVLAEIADEVFSIEVLPEIAAYGRENLRRLGYRNVQIMSGDGLKGWPENAPFDAVIVTCAPESIPPALPDQLRFGGRLVLPMGPEGGEQSLVCVTKTVAGLKFREICKVRFVPMTGGGGDGEDH